MALSDLGISGWEEASILTGDTRIFGRRGSAEGDLAELDLAPVSVLDRSRQTPVIMRIHQLDCSSWLMSTSPSAGCRPHGGGVAFPWDDSRL